MKGAEAVACIFNCGGVGGGGFFGKPVNNWNDVEYSRVRAGLEMFHLNAEKIPKATVICDLEIVRLDESIREAAAAASCVLRRAHDSFDA